MCKILIMAGITDETRANAWKFAMEAGKQMSFNPEKDGLGYAAVTNEGKIFGERWLENRNAFKERNLAQGEEAAILQAFQGALTRESSYNNFGDLEFEKMTAITLHTRFATSPKGLMNCHPFVQDGTTLIHNGVISNVSELEYLQSTCDSEGILTSYLADEVNDFPENMTWAASRLRGSYACGVFSTNSEGTLLDIFRNSGSNLTAMKIKELDTLVFATNLWTVETTCKTLGFTIEFTFQVEAEKLMRLDPVTGQVISVTEFDSSYVPPKVGKVVQLPGPNNKPAEVEDQDITEEELAKLDPFYHRGHGYKS